MLKVVDSFTTRDGSWEPNGLPYSITKEAAEKYGLNGIHGKGAAHHIFVRAPWSSLVVEFDTEDGKNNTKAYPSPAFNGWVSFPIFQAYDPDRGEVGPWLVRIDGEKVAEGIGLPYGWHVSTFLVVEDVVPIPIDAGPAPTLPPVQGGDKIQFIVNGVTIWSN